MVTTLRRPAKRRRVERSLTDFLAMTRRCMRRCGTRVWDDVDLTEILVLRDDVEGAIALGVAQLRRQGYSWGYVAAALGVARESAWERYRRHPDVVAAEQERAAAAAVD